LRAAHCANIGHLVRVYPVIAGDDPTRWPIIDDLVANLPEENGKKYLAVFSLSHGDADHCRGFRRLLEDENVLIGDLWFSPRILSERGVNQTGL
jgi:hypothetical protein